MPVPPTSGSDRFALKLKLFYAAYFLYGGIQLPFFPLWLEARGLDARMIGLVIAVPMLVRVFVNPIAGHLADRYAGLKTALVIASAWGALAMTMAGLADGGIAILVWVAISALAFSPVLSLSDAYALNGLGARGRAYGPVRLWGSVAFIAGNVGAGVLLGAIAPDKLIWLIVAALVATVIAATALESLGSVRPVRSDATPSPSVLWRNPAFLAVAAAASLTQSSHALYYGFSVLDWRAAGLDGTTIGLLWGLGVLAEIALFALSPRLPPVFGTTVLLAVGAIGALVRWTAMAFEPSVGWLTALQVLHALSFGAAHLGAMAFLARAVPKELSGTAQGLLATVSGIVMASATGLSGLLYAASGSLAYLAMAAMALAGLACALWAHRLSRI